ncbi:hypothetical protein KP509_39G049300 [Ceratopteris richardii]|uniref:non-specific serine/threonine protein kinase n=1 Tax=Ceratopteris richardii TaxID=49495 RepID=A0A8T2Q1D4_CERRI|nr:hypothetical protein KP509_39G049300 [Ceratopteris richardii]KAH7277403.1 hypothetical protein KP509_39G049300 [Ceratopteris richardii]
MHWKGNLFLSSSIHLYRKIFMGVCVSLARNVLKWKKNGGKTGHPNPFDIEALYVAGAPQFTVFHRSQSEALIQEGVIITDKYVFGKELGRGEFGITYLCTDKVTKEVVACKSISKRKLRTAVDVEDVRREASIMHRLPPHPNIVILKGVYEDENAVHLVMELCEGGELFDRIVARGHYNERDAAKIARTIVEVVQACHNNGVIHRDLKPENFLFAKKNENSPLKAIDFGLSVTFKPGEKFSEIVGSPFYMAPEVLRRNYGPEVDIWSAGVIIYILLCGVPPFWAETEQGVANAILHGVIDFTRDPWSTVSHRAKSLVKKMLEMDVKHRLTVQQVLEHPWLQNLEQVPEVPLGEVVQSRLKHFAAMNKLKKKALRVIAELMSGEEVEALRIMFNFMDTDKNGVLSYEEFKIGLRKLGSHLTEPEIRQLMDVGDMDKQGTLDYGKFAALTLQLQKLNNDDYLREAFSYFDMDGNGFIDVFELKQALIDELGPDDESVVSEIMREVDTNKDGRISYEEFTKMMQSGIDWRKVSRHYSRERLNSLGDKLMTEGTLPPSKNDIQR